MKKNMKKKEEKQRKSKRNIHIIFVTWLFVILFAAMSVYIVNYSISNRQELISNSYNGRQKILAAKNIRGTIYSRDGDAIVYSTVNDEGTEVRTYAYGSLFSHVIGYAVNGKMGVEEAANYYLINSNAPISEKAEHDAKGEKYPGDSVHTSLDVKLQQVASKALGVYSGAIIVTDPSTGEILAMVSKPDFDPALVEDKWDEYLADEESGVLVNRVTQGLYPPGSTFKIITTLEYLRENNLDYKSYHYTCTGKYTTGEDTIKCFHGSVHGSVDLKTSFAKSCNSSFANLGFSLDRDSFGKRLNELLYNNELPTELSTTVSKLTVNSDTSDSDMLQISIGQGAANISPIQLNMITCAICNKGVLMEPHVITKVTNSVDTVIKSFKPVEYGSLMTEEEAAIMIELMEGVVEEGTATTLKGQKYYAGGKTGSAEFGEDASGSHAWFTGFAGMADDEEDSENNTPDICVTIIVEEAGVGGDYAVPIAKRLFDAYYDLD